MASFDPTPLGAQGTDARRRAALAVLQRSFGSTVPGRLTTAKEAVETALNSATGAATIDLTVLSREELVGFGLFLISARSNGAMQGVLDPLVAAIVTEFNGRPYDTVMRSDLGEAPRVAAPGPVIVAGRAAGADNVSAVVTGTSAVRKARRP
jgi:hypothetical protein